MESTTLSQLLALPIQSAARAQLLAAQESISLFQQAGIENGKAKLLSFDIDSSSIKNENSTKDKTIEQSGGVSQVRINVPVLSMIQPSQMNLKEMTVEFGVDIKEVKTLKTKSGTTVADTTLTQSQAVFSSRYPNDQPTMKVSMKIVQEVPEGMARLYDLLTDSISGQLAKRK